MNLPFAQDYLGQRLGHFEIFANKEPFIVPMAGAILNQENLGTKSADLGSSKPSFQQSYPTDFQVNIARGENHLGWFRAATLQDTDISQFDSPGEAKRGPSYLNLAVDHTLEVSLGRGPQIGGIGEIEI